ncbi:DUF2480 family protein [Sphingobacterium sp. SYP-B4668]|uniref:DUF2480 family protein n=1 Tax=Sphingobacterium sp. SYP-B4668 TaxID=2996035 RepID=UPI0022DE15C2|nr:DUF2480 family protein [Sphingobacterium sp. SYP-B4668]
MNDFIVNKVQLSGIIGLDLQDYAPTDTFIDIDLKDMLYKGLMLREKEFKEALSKFDTFSFRDKMVSIYCSSEAIVPQWAYMLITQKLSPYSISIQFGDPKSHYENIWIQNIRKQDFGYLSGKKVSIKNDIQVPENIFIVITQKLLPIVSTLLYGEVGMPKVIYKN